MNLKNIRAFLEVTATGSFQQAAENLHITQSGMSSRIKGLERMLNRQLFRRKRNGAMLTAAGHAFHRHALTLVKTWELAQQETALPEQYTRVVNLGVQLNHWSSIANHWLDWMKHNAPELATQVHSAYSDQLMELLRDGLLDMALLYEPKQSPGLVVEQHAVEQLMLVSTCPRTVQKQRVENYVFVDWGHGFRKDHSRAFPETPTHAISVGLAMVGLNHILEQDGSGYFLERDVSGLIAAGKLFAVKDAPRFNLTIYLACFAETAATPAVRKALQGLAQISRDTAAGDPGP